MPQTFPTMNPTANRQPVFRSRRQLAPRRTERGRWPTRGMTLTLREIAKMETLIPGRK